MKFDKPESVASVIYTMREAERKRAVNRALINDLFNGEQPYTDSEAEENNINTNVNFLDASKLAHEARNTLNNAFLKPGYVFTVTLDTGPLHKRRDYGRIITRNINRCIKKAMKYMESCRSEYAQTVLHGIGPSIWDGPGWCPEPVALGDILIPSRTRVSLDNLDYFAVLRRYTPAKFYKKTQGEKVSPGWNKAKAKKVWEQFSETAQTGTNWNEYYNPEEVSEAIKEDIGFYEADSIPTINLWDFYYRNEESEQEEWMRKCILDTEEADKMGDAFLYKSKSKYADSLGNIVHFMFGDGANVAPFRYHSVRGLGWLLYAVCELQNRLRCKFTDAAFEHMLWYFRVSNPSDRERLDKVDLHHLGIIPEGLNFVTGQERYTINPAIINQAFGMNRESMNDSASSFRSDAIQGTDQDMTATEVMARVNASTSLTGSTLSLSYTYETYKYYEICRRFGGASKNDPDVREFREACKKEGVPEEFLDYKKWNIEPERVLGSGNKTLEIAQAQELMKIRNLLDPEPQREVLRDFISAVTDDPKRAEHYVPIANKEISESITYAQSIVGSLLSGARVAMKKGLNHIEVIEALMVAMADRLASIRKAGGVNSLLDIEGLNNLGEHIVMHMQIVAQDPNEKNRVKLYGDTLGKFGNEIKALAQQWQEKMRAENTQPDPEQMAKIQGQVMMAQTNSQIKQADAEQKRMNKQLAFEQKQGQQSQSHQLELARKATMTQAEIQAMDAEAAADMSIKAIEAQTQPQSNDRT